MAKSAKERYFNMHDTRRNKVLVLDCVSICCLGYFVPLLAWVKVRDVCTALVVVSVASKHAYPLVKAGYYYALPVDSMMKP